MKTLRSKICVTALAAAMAMSGVAPLVAAPMVKPGVPQVTSDVEQIQHRNPGNRGDARRHYRGGGNHFRRDGNRAWYRGHPGYRHYRPGYREYNGFWFPAAAFLAGAAISGALANQNPPPPPDYRAGGSHEQWCYNRYRSYRAYDNTFQPYNGPRRQCRSPYG
jgi:hypothetical protein